MHLKRTLFPLLLLLSLVAMSGCADNSPDGLVKLQIRQMNKMADAIEAEKPNETLKSIQEDLAATGKKLDALNLSAEEKAALVLKHKDELQKAAQRMMQHSMKMMELESKQMFEDIKNKVNSK